MLIRQRFGPSNLTSLAEGSSRFTVLRPNADRCIRSIMARLVAVLGSLPFTARGSITSTGAGSSSAVRTCTPMPAFRLGRAPRAHRGQNGTSENTNRHMIEPTTISGPLNAAQCKCLGWKTPAKGFREKALDRRA